MAYPPKLEPMMSMSGMDLSQSLIKEEDIAKLPVLTHAISQIKTQIMNEIEGSLIVVKVGSDKNPAQNADVKAARKCIEEAIRGTKGVKLIVATHNFDIQQLTLSDLRQIQSELLQEDETETEHDLLGSIEV